MENNHKKNKKTMKNKITYLWKFWCIKKNKNGISVITKYNEIEIDMNSAKNITEKQCIL